MLSKITDPKVFYKYKVIYFRAPEYPLNFFRLFFNFLKRDQQIKVVGLSINKVSDWQSCQPLLEVSFLGSSSYYWFHKLGIDTKNRKKVYEYLANYNGPHTIFVFVDTKDTLPKHSGLEILLDSKKKIEDIIKLLPIGNSYRITQFVKRLQKKIGLLTIDQICILIRYGALVRDVDEFETVWVHKIIQSEQSLFELSKHFLLRDSVLFYPAWIKVKDLYSPQFWMMFFSEQLFRAYYFVKYQKENNYRLAKQIGFRLPFDFIKLGWRYADPVLLKESHNLLYQTDYNLKNGSSDIWLDLFINKFLTSNSN
jgi:hypothetical protein